MIDVFSESLLRLTHADGFGSVGDDREPVLAVGNFLDADGLHAFEFSERTGDFLFAPRAVDAGHIGDVGDIVGVFFAGIMSPEGGGEESE